MAVLGDRELAGLLSAIAEAPDISAATAHLLAQLADLTAARRAVMFKLDSAQHSLIAVASLGFGDAPPAFSISLGDLSSPLVISALSLVPMQSGSEIGLQALDGMAPWIALPMSQPLQRGSLEVMKRGRAAELIASRPVTMRAPPEHRVATAPAGCVVLAGEFDDATTAAAIELVVLASPIVARVAALHETSEAAIRLSQHRERLTLVVESLPDPVVITNAANDIVVQNHRAERLLQARDNDSVGRRRAVELNNLLLTAFLSKAAMSGGVQHGPRELNLVDPDEGNDLLFEVLAHPLGERAGPDESVLSVLRDVTDLRRAANELERQVQRVRLAEISVRGERDRLNLVLENVADPILVTDERSNIILMNDQAEHAVPGERVRAAHAPRVGQRSRERHEVHVVHLRVRDAGRRFAPGANDARLPPLRDEPARRSRVGQGQERTRRADRHRLGAARSHQTGRERAALRRTKKA